MATIAGVISHTMAIVGPSNMRKSSRAVRVLPRQCLLALAFSEQAITRTTITWSERACGFLFVNLLFQLRPILNGVFRADRLSDHAARGSTGDGARKGGDEGVTIVTSARHGIKCDGERLYNRR
jgi:hypothetical protein